ncbi:hypothetical protein PY310_05330 [Pseudarthrobacter sp. H3Y2-7]|uniref:hypothetical protein n=1 Tax=Pseudarthrobacter naphthalenicus TaxID=3031328 RepID=UPI0023AEFB1D|nr:hypothetical protein [Pseudarthrobacter sp. H3Y2-7]MDE8668005.1 hypothetical protein [Pseudarthrobacter sp. H3Y2-7]
MNTQGKRFKVSALVAIAGTVLALVLMVAFGGVRGGAVSALMTIEVSLLVIAAVSACVALAAYREQGRKPGSTPLIYAVIAFPLGFLLFFLYFPMQFPPLAMLAMLSIATSIPALIIGIVKKLSVKSAPAPAI